MIFFVTIPVENTFRNFLTTLVGSNNIFTYTQFIDKLKEKLLRLYNPKIFLLKINNKVQNCRVLGKVNCNATNLIIGNNVTIYPNVTFWGDGEIRIGDNVDIGYNTIIFFKKWWCLHW